MTGYLGLGGILLAAPFGLCIAHAIVSRVVRYCGDKSVPPQTVALGTIVAGNIPVAWIAWEAFLKTLSGNLPEVLSGFTYVLATYNACSFCYLNALNMSETSLHVNILMRLLIEDGMPLDELSRIYGVKDMINARIDRMIVMGQLEEKDQRYFTGNRTLVLIGRVINVWRRILSLPLSPS
jgi:hypothetical protein